MSVTRISFTSHLGHTAYISIAEALKRVARKRAEWIEKGVSLRAITVRNFVDYSNVLTSRCFWRPKESGGVLVLQLTDSMGKR